MIGPVCPTGTTNRGACPQTPTHTITKNRSKKTCLIVFIYLRKFQHLSPTPNKVTTPPVLPRIKIKQYAGIISANIYFWLCSEVSSARHEQVTSCETVHESRLKFCRTVATRCHLLVPRR